MWYQMTYLIHSDLRIRDGQNYAIFYKLLRMKISNQVHSRLFLKLTYYLKKTCDFRHALCLLLLSLI